MANSSGPRQAQSPDAKRLKIESSWSASSFESAPQHLPPPQEVSGYASQYPPQHLQASTPYIDDGPSGQTLPPPQSHLHHPQVNPNPYSPTGPTLPHGSGTGRTFSDSSIAPLPPHLSTQHSHPQQPHRGSIDERSHLQPLRPLAVPPHSQSFQRGHPQNSATSTSVSGPGQLVSPTSAGGNYGGGGSVNVTPVNPTAPMSFQPRQGSIHGTMEGNQGGMLNHFQLGGMGQNQNSSPSPVMGQGMGMGMPMYPQQAGPPGQVVTTYPPRRKAIRAAQACDACRARKAKCDEGRPSCGFCKETGVPCIYREVPPPKQDRTLLEILNRLGNIEQILNRQEAAAGDTTPGSEGPTGPVNTTTAPIQPPQAPSAQEQISERSAPRAMLSPAESRPLPSASMDSDDDDAGFPYHHTTAAHKLLLWPSIQRLVENDCGEWAEGYVHALEEGRGNLKIWGRGEYLPASQQTDPNSWFEDGHESPIQGNEGRKGAFSEWPSVPENSRSDSPWRNNDQQAGPGTSNMNGPSNGRGYGGNAVFITGLAADGESLNFDQETLMRLLQSYLDNIHILHPILNRAIITKMVRVFSERVSPDSSEHVSNVYNQPGQSRSMAGDQSPVTPGPLSRKPSMQSVTSPTIGKRKRAGSLAQQPPTYGQQPIKARRVPRTIHSAVVLLVMALGAVCLHRRPVPGPLPPKLPGHYLPPDERDLRNIDIIPGLAYFTKATEIMGAEVGANELENVQAGLLAGLYWGQLGRILDSWKWISWACLSCQVLVRSRMSLEKDDLRKELIRRSFWSCLQLESDVLAELDLPPSGISRLEDTVPFPGGEYTNEVDEAGIDVEEPNMIMYYLAQIALRKLLNRVHSELYKQRKTPTDITRSLNIAHELDFQLEQWKLHLPEPLRWEETDEPSGDINAARLRAKYFGARYIIHRPFVYLAIHGGPRPNFTNQYNSPRVSHGDPGSQHPSPIQTVSTPIQPTFTNALTSASARKASMAIALDEYTPSHKTTVEESCKKCLDAAVQSTKAFHAFSVSEFRPVITNVFGTAHAQFGNLLVLQAALNSNVTKELVDGRQLEGLFIRTLEWYRTLAPISPALKRDLHILEGVYSRARRD
ncbi:hypothetical protein BJ508DRAFT_222926 [Ascobolus immersus RN42]|uniref:Zn(2)-C6 fungal-type domain-containing protein n=1 Tax=Ascobolus immersus RN42 TaxID=1160509 RepID=A0A3N4IES5_ASCIM|nr:hypothetical protein BJ508DRAFT_222926 [Ascobolus immersus RN42]